MAATCIVCLLDLEAVEPPSAASSPPGHDCAAVADLTAPDRGPANPEPKLNEKSPLRDGDLVAHLPCGHFLHNDCLKPWVERANSCPTCRATFNVVELVAKMGGPVLDSYTVVDKQQVAEVDLGLIVDDDFDIEEAFEEESCMICEEYGSGSGRMHLLECDACERFCHVFCAGLDERPQGEWFCPHCIENPHNIASARRQARSTVRRRPRARRAPSRDTNAWARVWQSVWNTLRFDLDYPFDDDEETPRWLAQEQESQRHEINEWQRRFRLASRQGAGDRFRQTAAALLHRNPPPTTTEAQPNPESQEELRAWNAFDKARDAREVPSPGNSRKRKSKSASTSPREPDTEERALKRPRTRRAQETASMAGPSVAESSRRSPATRSPRRRSPVRQEQESTDTRPSFLQSLLKEVEVCAKTDDAQRSSSVHPVPMIDLSERASSPQSSPGGSPTASNHPTPRAGTPPPLSLTRPSSPPISSTVRPIYPLAPNFSPTSQTASDGPPNSERQSRSHHPHHSHTHNSRSSSPRSSKDTSPSRVSLSTKSEIQSMVRAALDTLYHQRKLNKDQYTDINRDVSRMLYDRVGDDAEGLGENGKVREKWQNIATQEVEAAVRALRDVREKEKTRDRDQRKGKEKEDDKDKALPAPTPTKGRIVIPTPSWSPTVQAGGDS